MAQLSPRSCEWGIGKMFWRASLLFASLFVVCLVVDLSSHKEFASATIQSSSDSNYFIKCDVIDFSQNDTHVSVRLIDKNRFPQFQTFRDTYPPGLQADGDRKLSLETDLRYFKPDQVLLAQSSTEPAVLFRPKPNNQVHEAILNLWFQPLKVSEASDRLEVDEVWLNFPAFPPISVKRKRPLSQEQDFWNEMHNLAVVRMSQPVAFVLLGLGCLGMVSMVGPVSKDLQILMFRRRLNLAGDAPVGGSRRKGRRRYDARNHPATFVGQGINFDGLPRPPKSSGSGKRLYSGACRALCHRPGRQNGQSPNRVPKDQA